MEDRMNYVNRAIFLSATSVLGIPALAGCAGAPGETEAMVGQETQAVSDDFCPAGIPASLTPAANQTLKAHFTGIGSQVYICNATPTGFGWTFVTPQANLLDESGTLVGTHFIGPTWQGNDGSAVVGTKVAGVSVDPTAVPWLLLTAASVGGDGRFADVTSIQRLSTVGGVAPASGCDATKLGTIAQVPYSAQYVFYKTKDHGKTKQCAGN
jgi:hypothetical protein